MRVAPLILPLLLTLLLCTSPAIPQDAPWVLGDETTVACFNNTNVGDTSQPTLMNVAGIDLRWITPLPSTLTAGVPINSQVSLNLQSTFYTNNTGIVIPDPNSDTFSMLCLKRINPLNQLQAACLTPITNATCCVNHMNWHFCSMSYLNNTNCMPWLVPSNTTSGAILITGSPSQVGFPGQTWSSSNFSLTQPDRYTILAHFKMLNMQCAIGAIRTVNPAPVVSSTPPVVVINTTTTTTTTTPTPNPSNPSLGVGAIAGIAVGGVGVIAIAAVAAILLTRSKRNSDSPVPKDGPKDDPKNNPAVPKNYPDNHSASRYSVSDPASHQSTPIIPNRPAPPPHRSPVSSLAAPYTPSLVAGQGPTPSTATPSIGEDGNNSYSPQLSTAGSYVYDNPTMLHHPQQQPFYMPYPVDGSGGPIVFQGQPFQGQPFQGQPFQGQPFQTPSMYTPVFYTPTGYPQPQHMHHPQMQMSGPPTPAEPHHSPASGSAPPASGSTPPATGDSNNPKVQKPHE
ncbi:hypothetical protein BC938DRAFT_474759 [Jimgerdemannia flammicorona]|uniref:Uncharacterized protein n=1 Tax=Jimgerdemannia flammicorona TaxID=994334 RepID=A0A433Q1K7_9FUNG|nr:hypothetical protein BC938DRAFT_474759 [Jimgerdemannia flammicorona]